MRIALLGLAVLLAIGLPTPGAAAERLEICRSKLMQAQKLDVLTDLDWKPPKPPQVVVGPTFAKLPFDAKEGFVETVNCFLVGGKRKYVNFEVLDSLNHHAVGAWTNGRFAAK